jgi:hypothetical protein
MTSSKKGGADGFRPATASRRRPDSGLRILLLPTVPLFREVASCHRRANLPTTEQRRLLAETAANAPMEVALPQRRMDRLEGWQP